MENHRNTQMTPVRIAQLCSWVHLEVQDGFTITVMSRRRVGGEAMEKHGKNMENMEIKVIFKWLYL